MRAVGDPGCIAGGLDARDVALDLVHVDDGAGRAVVPGDLGGEGRGHDLSSCSDVVGWVERSETHRRLRERSDGFCFALPILQIPLFQFLHVTLPTPASGLLRRKAHAAPWRWRSKPPRISCDP